MCLYDDVSVTVTFLRYLGSVNLIGISLCLTFYPSSGIFCKGSGSSGSDSGLLSCLMKSYIPSTRSCSLIVWNIFVVSAGLVTFHYEQLTSILIMTLLVSGLYSLYVSLVWVSTYPTIIDLNVLSFI